MEKRQKRGKYTPADFYEHGKNHLTYAQLAERYEVSESAIGAQLAKPDLKAAFKAGKNGEPFPSGDAFWRRLTSIFAPSGALNITLVFRARSTFPRF